MHAFLAWLRTLPFTDTIERQQAKLLQAMLLFLIGSTIVGLPISLVSSRRVGSWVGVISYLLILAFMVTALFILQRGKLRMAASIAIIVLALVIGANVFFAGLSDSGTILAALMVPLVLGGLISGRHGLILAASLTLGILGLDAILETTGMAFLKRAPLPAASPFNVLATFAICAAVVMFLVDRFGNSLGDALRTAQSREHELETLRDSLELQVAEQTAELKTALVDVEQREARLRQLVQDLQEARNTVRDMSSPVIPVLDGVLVVPLIGAIDETRADELSENVLDAVERERARYVILDVTGLPIIDTHAARSLMQASHAVRLLGAQTMLAGIRPEVAQTLVSLGVDLSDVPAYAGLREAVAMLARNQVQPGVRG